MLRRPWGRDKKTVPLQPVIGARLRLILENCVALQNEEISIPGDTDKHFLLTTSILGRQDDELLQLVILHDITDYNQLKAMAQRHETLARLGEAISIINHEVKNVVQPIKYQLNVMLEEQTEDRTVRRATVIINERMNALEKLTANLRDLSRPIELSIRKIDLGDLVESVWLDLKDTPMASGVRLSREIGSNARECDADANWLRIVMFNLVKNAIEATAGRASPEISVASSIVNDAIQLRVMDNGVGIDTAHRKKLFSLFFSTKGEAGTGLGLSLCRRIVELHGGTIEVDSTLGIGSTFAVHLPLAGRRMGNPNKLL